MFLRIEATFARRIGPVPKVGKRHAVFRHEMVDESLGDPIAMKAVPAHMGLYCRFISPRQLVPDMPRLRIERVATENIRSVGHVRPIDIFIPI